MAEWCNAFTRLACPLAAELPDNKKDAMLVAHALMDMAAGDLPTMAEQNPLYRLTRRLAELLPDEKEEARFVAHQLMEIVANFWQESGRRRRRSEGGFLGVAAGPINPFQPLAP